MFFRLLDSATHNLWFLSIASFVLGFLFIALSYRLEKRSKHLWAHIARDVGIACLVAIIVTAIYELHVREILETDKMEDVLATVLKYNVPKNVWDEVHRSVLMRNVLRRNVDIEFEIRTDASLPVGLTFLTMKYSYDLYRLKSSTSDVTIRHAIVLDYKELAGFDYVRITDAHGKTLAEYNKSEDEGGRRRKDYVKEIHLQPAYDFKNDRFNDEEAVHVVNERTEVINLPGTYVLGITELTEGTKERPIRVSVKMPPGITIKPFLDTQWDEHTFTPNGEVNNRHFWYYVGTLLPGQFFDVRINEPVTSVTAKLAEPAANSQQPAATAAQPVSDAK